MKCILFDTRHLAIVFIMLSAMGCAEPNESADQPNILVILVDDLGKEWLSPYGGEDTGTPQLERLAAQGVTFDLPT